MNTFKGVIQDSSSLKGTRETFSRDLDVVGLMFSWFLGGLVIGPVKCEIVGFAGILSGFRL